MRGKFWMRWLLVAAALVLCLGLAACDPEDLLSARIEATRADTATFPVTGIPVLEIESSNGAVTVHGVPGQTDVRVVATVRSRGASQAVADERVAAVSLHMEQQGGRIVLAYRGNEQLADVRRYSGVAFEVTAPPMLDVSAVTSNGAISVDAVQGRFDLTTSNGQVTVSDAVGELEAQTSNGRIDISRCQGVLDLETSNGEITIVDVNATFDAQTSNGAIVFSGTIIGESNSLATSNGRIDVSVSPTASVEFAAVTSAGSITSSLPLVGATRGREWLATLNPPATAKISLRTSNGGIHILPRP